MPLQRRLDWSAAIRDMRNDRTSVERRRAHIAAQAAAKLTVARARAGVALIAGGSFNRSAIMAMAVRNARVERQNHPHLSWSACMADALRFAWACAKAARLAAAH